MEEADLADAADKTKFPILGSLYRCVRFHLGSLAMGSFILTLISTLRAVLAYIDAKTKEMQASKDTLSLLASAEAAAGHAAALLGVVTHAANNHVPRRESRAGRTVPRVRLRGRRCVPASSTACGPRPPVAPYDIRSSIPMPFIRHWFRFRSRPRMRGGHVY